MPRFDEIKLMTAIAQTRVVPVFYDARVDVACKVVKACYDGGVRVFEFTNRGDMAHEVFREVMLFASCECPDLILGVGSVVDAPTAALYLQLGANFVVGPMFNAEVARLCNRRCVSYVPGCGSITEVSAAQEAGCRMVKLFPGDVLSPKFVKALLAPMPWTKIMVTGGVEPTADNLRSWFSAGACCVGMGSKLFPRQAIDAADWAAISDRCRASIAAAVEG